MFSNLGRLPSTELDPVALLKCIVGAAGLESRGFRRESPEWSSVRVDFPAALKWEYRGLDRGIPGAPGRKIGCYITSHI